MKTYVRVSSSVTIYPDFGKNYNLIRNNGGDGNIIMQAIRRHSGSYNYWSTRVFQVNDYGGVDWSFDYVMDAGWMIKISTAPFDICINASGDGYVIAGAWQNVANTSINHQGQQLPFYIEINNVGGVVQYLTQDVNTLLPDMGFVPLDIESDGEGYVVAGVYSEDMECISCARKFGRIAELNSSFTETDANVIHNNYTIDASSTQPGKDSYFDALNHVKVVRDDEGGGYIVSGALTEFLLNWPLDPLYDDVGSSSAFIARLDEDMDIVWIRSLRDNEIQQVTADFTVDYSASVNSVHIICNVIYAASAQIGNYLELDLSTGATIYNKGLDIHHYRLNHNTNIFVDEEYIYICGYAQALTSGPAIGRLMPMAMKYVKGTHAYSNVFFIESDNYGYNQLNMNDGYLCNYYTDVNASTHKDLVEVTYSGGYINYYDYVQPPQLIFTPVIYTGSPWFLDPENGLSCVVSHLADNLIYTTYFTFAASPQFFPALYTNIQPTDCNYTEDDTELLLDYTVRTPGVTTIFSNLHDEVNLNLDEKDLTMIFGEDCNYNTSIAAIKHPLTHDVLIKKHSSFAIESINQLQNILNEADGTNNKIYRLYDVYGRELSKGNLAKISQHLHSGVYFIQSENDNQFLKKLLITFE